LAKSSARSDSAFLLQLQGICMASNVPGSEPELMIRLFGAHKAGLQVGDASLTSPHLVTGLVRRTAGSMASPNKP
jgi:hypothetical protein